MQFSKEDLQEFAALAQMLLELKDAEEVQAILNAIPQLAAQAKPLVEGLNAFSTSLDIAAVKQIMDAGFTAEQAISLRTSGKANPIAAVLQNISTAKKAKE